MGATRRALLGGLIAGSALAGCSRGEHSGRASGADGIDGGVLAAGQPAAVLIWALAPERLLGWPRRPSPEALAALPAGAARLPQLGALASGGGPADLEVMAALNPSTVIDYGDTDPAYVALGERMQARLSAPWRLIDGTLTRTPDALIEAASAMDVAPRGRLLADRAKTILDRWSAGADGPSFYQARGADGLETTFAGALGAEVLEGAGWANVAVGGRDVSRVAREQVAAWDPEVIVTLTPAFAASAAEDPVWRRRRDGSRRRLLLLPEAPFGWIDRPPSINRLIGCDWLAGDPFAADPTSATARTLELTRLFYGASATPAAPAMPRWIA